MSDRQAALDMALKQIEKQFGKGSIMKLGEQTDQRVSTIPSGSLALDVALRCRRISTRTSNRNLWSGKFW